MIQPMDSIDIRVGTEDDAHAIIQFASALSEDPFSSREKWYKTLENKNIYPLLAVYKQNIVGKIQARILGKYGWLEAARVNPDFRKMGLAHTLVDTAMDWLISQGVKHIRTLVDSDNMAARKIVERHHFSPQFLTVNPSARVDEETNNPTLTADFAPVLDEELHQHFKNMLEPTFGNIMINGHYLPFTKDLLSQLIDRRQIYTNLDQSILLIISKHNLPSEVHGFVMTDTKDKYALAARALKGFTGREMATLAICHAPSQRDAVVGLAMEHFAWNQPHSIIVYGRGSWQERESPSDSDQ